MLDHSQDQDDTWNRNTKGLSLLELLCEEHFSLGTTGKHRCWSMLVSKRMASLWFCRRVKGLRKKSKIFCWGNTSSGLKILGKWSQREGDQDPKHTLASWRCVSVSLVHKREAVSEALTCIAYVLAGNWKQRPQDLTEISIRPCHGLSELFIFGHVCSWDNRGSSHLQLYPRATAAPFILKS